MWSFDGSYRRVIRGVETRGKTQVVFVDTPGIHQARGGLHAFMIDEVMNAARPSCP